jgi:hypothetical protein
LRRELRERFSGSMAGWVWAVVAPLIRSSPYTLVFGGSATLPNKTQSSSSIDYASFIFGGLVAFNFFTEMATGAPRCSTNTPTTSSRRCFPAEMLPIISTLRGDDLCLDRPGADAGLPASLHRDAALDRAAAASVVHPVPDVPDRHHLAVVCHGGVHARHRLPHDDHRPGADVRHAGVLQPRNDSGPPGTC